MGASPFLSVDPAAPASGSSVHQLRFVWVRPCMKGCKALLCRILVSWLILTGFREVLLNEEKGMYERYAALFGLRNLGGDKAIFAIIEALGANSALLRHEVCYHVSDLSVRFFKHYVNWFLSKYFCDHHCIMRPPLSLSSTPSSQLDMIKKKKFSPKKSLHKRLIIDFNFGFVSCFAGCLRLGPTAK